MIKSKKVLLTGATGFLGSHLLMNLIKSGCQVTILKRSSSDTSRIKDIMKKTNIISMASIDPLRFAQEKVKALSISVFFVFT